MNFAHPSTLTAIILLLLVTFTKNGVTQVDILNLSLTHPDSNILYLGVDNKLQIINTTSPSELELQSEGRSTISNTSEDDKFTIHPALSDKEVLGVYRNQKLIFSDTFPIRRIPNPVVQLGVIDDSSATIKEILNNPSLHVFLPNCYLKAHFYIYSFEFSVMQDSVITPITPRNPDSTYIDTIYTINPVSQNDTVIIATSKGSMIPRNYGNSLTPRQLDFVADLKKGDIILFETIRFSGTHSSTRTINLRLVIE